MVSICKLIVSICSFEGRYYIYKFGKERGTSLVTLTEWYRKGEEKARILAGYLEGRAPGPLLIPYMGTTYSSLSLSRVNLHNGPPIHIVIAAG